MEEGKLGKPYDLKLMLRLGGFLRPYWRLIAFSLFFVLIMAGLDLLIPYLTKEAIDRYIVVAAREVVLRGDDSPEERRFLNEYGQKFISEKEKGKFLLPPDVLQSMDRREMTHFEKYGILTENRYYLFTPTPAEEPIIKKYPSLFEKSGSYWFVPMDRMKDLKREDLLALRGRDIQGVFHIGLLVILILAVNFGLNFSQVYAMELAGQRMMHGLRMKVFSHLQGLPVSFFDRNPVGRLVTRLTNDVQNVHEMFTSVLVNLLKDILLVIGIVILLLELNRPLALVSFSVIPLIFVVTLFFSRQARDAFREIRLKIAQMNSYFHENFSGIQVVQLFRREAENGRRFRRINDGYYLANMKQISIYAFFVPLVEILSSGAIGLLIWYGGGEVIRGMITLGVLVAFLSYIRMFFQPIRDLSEKYNVLQSAMASLERIFSLLDQDQQISKSTRPLDKLRAPSPAKPKIEWLGTKPFSPRREEIKGNIEFSHVSFSYNGEDRVLKDVSFSVREGETVAIVGATGAGKTSLLHLLEGFYEVEDGAILVDGIDIRERDLAHLRSQIGLVMQDTFLFSGDIRENIRMGDMEVSDEKLREVSRRVNAEKFIQRLPNGYGTVVGEGGEVLSAGERQLLAFARALSIDPKVLILDEATSHVDPETERLIQEGLSQLLKGRTAIVIAHRLSTIRHADRIVVLHKGRVREIGSHAELMALKGIYFRLYQMQFGKT